MEKVRVDIIDLWFNKKKLWNIILVVLGFCFIIKKIWKIDLFKIFGDIDYFYWSIFIYNINLGWVDNYDIYCYFLI